MPKISALPPMTTAADDDEAPIVDKSVTTTKKWTLTLLKTYLQSLVGWLTTAMLADDSVTAAKIDWASTGANGGIWWEELGRTQLSVAGDTISVTGMTARKHLMVILYTAATGGTVNSRLQYNGDTAANYAERSSSNGGADATGVNATNNGFTQSASAATRQGVGFILNEAAQEKIITSFVSEQNTAGAANAPTRAENSGKWANTSAQITRIDAINTGTGDFAIGSRLIVLGHD